MNQGVVVGLGVVAACAVGYFVFHSMHEHGTGGNHGHEHGAGDSGHPVEIPPTYGEAVARCRSLSDRIGSLIEGGSLDQVHVAAEEAGVIAGKLAELAEHDLERSVLRDVNVTARDLVGLLEELHDLADDGKGDEARAVHGRIGTALTSLERQGAARAAGGGAGNGHEHH